MNRESNPLGAGLAALLIVTGCSAVAPAHKRLVAVVTFLAGTGIALFMGLSGKAFEPMVTAILVGAVAATMVGRRNSPANPRTDRPAAGR
jgi:hypothetical protein